MVFKAKIEGELNIDIDVDIKPFGEITEVRFVFSSAYWTDGLTMYSGTKDAILYLGDYQAVVPAMGAFEYSLHGLPWRVLGVPHYLQIPRSEFILYYHSRGDSIPKTPLEAFQRLKETVATIRVKARLLKWR